MKFKICRICGSIIFNQEAFCTVCSAQIYKLPLYKRKQNNLDTYSIFEYTSATSNIIARCKNGKDKELLKSLAKIAATKIGFVQVASINGVIPVPAKQNINFDHAFMLAFFVALNLGVGFFPNFVLHKSQNIQKQDSLIERQNVSMQLLRHIPQTNRGVWLLVDDVITTGFTLLELHRTLFNQPCVSLTLATRLYQV